MRSKISVCFGSLHLAYGQNVDPECACNLGNLWLDVVVVIDNSQGMGHDGLNQVIPRHKSILSLYFRLLLMSLPVYQIKKKSSFFKV